MASDDSQLVFLLQIRHRIEWLMFNSFSICLFFTSYRYKLIICHVNSETMTTTNCMSLLLSNEYVTTILSSIPLLH